MKELKKFIAEQNELLTEKLTKQINELKDELKNITTKLVNLEKTVDNLQTKNKNLEKIVKENNILLFNSGYNNEELLDFTINKLNNCLELKLEANDISKIFVLGRNLDSKIIVVKFTRFLTKQAVLKNCHKLKGKKLSISDDLTEEERIERKQLIKYLREARSKQKKSHIYKNKLFINSKGYTYQDLINGKHEDEEEDDSVLEEDYVVEKEEKKSKTKSNSGSHTNIRTRKTSNAL